MTALRFVSIHEAGHAVAAVLLGDFLKWAELDPVPAVWTAAMPPTTELVVLAAGPMAARHAGAAEADQGWGGEWPSGDLTDRARSRQLGEQHRLPRWEVLAAQEQASRLVGRHGGAVCQVADLLERWRTVYPSDVRRILDGWAAEPPERKFLLRLAAG